MAFKVSVGKSDFAEIREAQDYYVDKTELIYELVNDTDNKVSLFTRPRRFGKTLMLSMINNFFNIQKNSKSLFDGLAITKHEDFCKNWMNQYPILYITFKDIEGMNFEDAYDMLLMRISEVCIGLADLIDNDLIDSDDIATFKSLKSRSGNISDVKTSLKTIMRMLNTVYGRKVILLIDEYDVPLAKASERETVDNPYYDRMLDVIRGIMSTAIKDNEHLQFAVITGCLRLAKESIFTGTNNFTSYSVLDERFSKYFGFSENEVDTMLKIADLSEASTEIKEWYDGYVFGNSYVYCPWDVMNHISALKHNKSAKPKNYWKNTSHNGILLTFVKRNEFNVKGKFEILLNNGTIKQVISDELTYDTLHSSENNLWSVLLMTGYVTKADSSEDGARISLKIPNKEIASIFEDTVVKLFMETIDNEQQKSMMDAFWNADTKKAEKVLSELLWKTISYHDYHEDYYHAFLAGLFVGLGYELDSNKEHGLGRPDILLKDADNRRAIIIEAKKSLKESDMDKDCEAALAQIESEQYADSLYGYNHVFCYGVAFFQKQAKIALLK